MYSKRAIFKYVIGVTFANVFFLMLCFTTTYAIEKQTIRGMHWGMKKAEVQAKEKWKLEEKTDRYLLYSGELKPGVKTNLTYEFYDGLLVGVTYSLDKNKATYRYFRALLGEKYGLPYYERTEAQSRQDIKLADEIAAKGGVAYLGYDLFQDLKNAARRFHAQWKIHKAEGVPNTHVIILYSPIVEVAIHYENFKYMNEKEQLEKDKERDASYSLKNGDDL